MFKMSTYVQIVLILDTKDLPRSAVDSVCM
jgi:hypothetical protein